MEMFDHAGIPFERAGSLRILSRALRALGSVRGGVAASAIFARLNIPDVGESPTPVPS